MKNSKFQNLSLNASTLTRQQMKNVVGGSANPAIVRPCFKCCPSDKCSPVRHYCLDVVCPE